MATISNTPRPGYAWDATDNVWYPIGVGQHSHGEIPATIVDAKGDIIAASAADTVARLAVGANDTVLTADSTTATGLKWATPAAGGMTLISTTPMSGSSSIALSSIPSTYNNLQLLIVGPTVGSGGNWRLYTTPSSGSIYAVGVVSGGNGTKNSIGETTIYAQTSTRTGYAINILDYASTNRKFYSAFGMSSLTQDSGFGEFGCIDASAALSDLTITNSSSVNFTGGTIYLYGVK